MGTHRGYLILLSKNVTLRLLRLFIGLYLLINISLILFVPFLHKVTLEVTALDDTSDSPLQEVEVSWLETNPATGFQGAKPFGATDAAGQLKHTMTVQEQPLWVYPVIGSFKLRNRTLQLTKQGYDMQILDLSKEVPAAPFRNPIVSVTARMKPSQTR